MKPLSKWLLLWEAALTSLSTAAASLSLTTLLPSRVAAALVIISGSLNMGTIVYKTGQWNPVVPPSIPVHLTAMPTTPPDPPAVAE